jgi:hypothetical protein
MIEKDAEIDKLREQIMNLWIESDNFRHSIEVEKLKPKTEINDMQTSFDLEPQRLNG